jgi:hypothetical protein
MAKSDIKKRSIELLAFLSMVKTAQSNSVLYKDADYKMAKKVGIGDGRTFTKYLSICIDMGLCNEKVQPYNTSCHRIVYKFISYNAALQQLLGIKEAQLKTFPLHKSVGSFKEYQYRIELDLAALNFSQQAYKAASNFPNKKQIIQEIKSLSQLHVSERSTRSAKSKQRKLVKKLGSADEAAKASGLKGHLNGVVTGCNHIGKVIGRSSTTGAKRIKKWIELNKLQVHDIVHFQPTSSELEAMLLVENLIKSKAKGIHLYSRKEKGVKTVVGKKVLGFTSGNYTYGVPMQ